MPRMENLPLLSVLPTRSKGSVVNAVSVKLLCNPTKMPLRGSRFDASSTVPETVSVSIFSPVEKVKVKLSKALPSLLSVIASPKSMV